MSEFAMKLIVCWPKGNEGYPHLADVLALKHLSISSSKREIKTTREDYHGFTSNTSLTSSVCKERSV